MLGSVRGALSNERPYRDKECFPGRRRRQLDGRQHGRRRQREQPTSPAWSKTLARAHAPCAGTGRSPVRPQAHKAVWSASGRRGAVADDARTGEVRLRHSSCEAGEQRRATVCGVGGAKGGGRGERGTGPHAPGSGPGKRVPGAGPRTAGSPSDTQGGSRMRESRPSGSVRGALGNERSYRDPAVGVKPGFVEVGRRKGRVEHGQEAP